MKRKLRFCSAKCYLFASLSLLRGPCLIVLDISVLKDFSRTVNIAILQPLFCGSIWENSTLRPFPLLDFSELSSAFLTIFIPFVFVQPFGRAQLRNSSSIGFVRAVGWDFARTNLTPGWVFSEIKLLKSKIKLL